jgi:pimeloyl-ACP methyl ester carboxylesterase
MSEAALLSVADTMGALPSGVRVWSWGEGPVALLVHGWGGRGAQLGSFVPVLVNEGWRVVAFDALAHGDSPGARTTLAEMADTIRAVADWHGPIDAVIAHSFGAAATTVALSRGLSAGRVAFLAPMVAVEASVERYVAALRLEPAARAAFLAALADANRGAGPDQLDGVRLAPSMTAPLLVVHDRADREVPFADGLTASRLWPGAGLIATEGLGHRKVLADPHVIGLVREFVLGAAPRHLVLDEAARIDRELADRSLRLLRSYV